MSRKVRTVLSLCVLTACLPVVAVFSEEPAIQAVRASAGKVIAVSLSYSQEGRRLEITASGTPVGDGVVITARHVFDNDEALEESGFDMAQPITVELSGCFVGIAGALRFPLKLKALSADSDVAVLKADFHRVIEMMKGTPWNTRRHRDAVSLYALLTRGIPIAAKEPVVADTVYFAGFAGGGERLEVSKGTFRSGSSGVLCNGTAEHGMSGGVILDRDGAIVGFISAGLDNGSNWVRGPAAQVLGKLRKGE